MLKPAQIIALIPLDAEKIIIAYSGGVDSHVLLHLLASNEQLRPKVTAVYINHGLQPEADLWADHCQAIALSLQVGFKAIKVNITTDSARSIEELAREARYQAFKPLLNDGGVILLAQHREDQLETVLLQLFRGAGVQGLSGMPLITPFGNGVMCRPLLDVSKLDINQYAIENTLQWVDDPSNKSNDFDRNFLRNKILPELKQKWPAIDKTVSRSARHCANAHQLSETLAANFYQKIINLDLTLNISEFIKGDNQLQRLGIRQWFKCNQLRMPAEKIVQCVITEVIQAAVSRSPELRGKTYIIRRYRDKLYCLKKTDNSILYHELLWPNETKRLNISSELTLLINESDHGVSKTVWESAVVSVKFRQGSEKIRLPGREGRHTLKKLYQEKGIPPWQRDKIPLIYLDNQLAAIADLWVSAEFMNSHNRELCYKIQSLNVLKG